MKVLAQRLAALETQKTTGQAIRWFTGYADKDRYYEVGQTPVDYRLGINNAAETGTAYTIADIEAIRTSGTICQVITVVYQDKPIVTG